MFLVLSLVLILIFYISKPNISYTQILIRINKVTLNGRIYSEKCITNIFKNKINIKNIGELDHPQ